MQPSSSAAALLNHASSSRNVISSDSNTHCEGTAAAGSRQEERESEAAAPQLAQFTSQVSALAEMRNSAPLQEDGLLETQADATAAEADEEASTAAPVGGQKRNYRKSFILAPLNPLQGIVSLAALGDNQPNVRSLSDAAELQAQLERERYEDFHVTKAESANFWGSAEQQLRAVRLSRAEVLRRSHCNNADVDDASLSCPMLEGPPKQVSATPLPVASSVSTDDLPQAGRKHCRVRLAIPTDESQSASEERTSAAGAMDKSCRISGTLGNSVVSSDADEQITRHATSFEV